MIKEAILLVGGLGTRLRSEVQNLPKSMAPINNKPFLAYQLDYLASFGINRIVMATGYLSAAISDYFGNSYKEIEIVYSIENEPLGTGGAIKQALDKTISETVLILNGDTMFKVDLKAFYENHIQTNADFSLALKPMENFDRYGVVLTEKNGKVVGFEEKKAQKQGNINGGVYILNKSCFNQENFDTKFSFEKSFLEGAYHKYHFTGFMSATYFLDIGIPADYQQAQVDFKTLFEKK